jgi:Domain of unknown function (DUF4159)
MNTPRPDRHIPPRAPSHPALMSSRTTWLRVLLGVVVAVVSLSLVSADDTKTPQRNDDKGAAAPVPEPRQSGGEPDGIVQVANLVYAGTKSSQCFSDHFLIQAEKESSISTSRRFHATKLGSEEVFGFPLVIMTGEGEFSLTDQERENLRQYVHGGGLLLASAGCSSREWDRSFRREMARIFPATAMQPLGLDHQVFHTVYDIKVLEAKHGKPRPLDGIVQGGRLGVVYSQDGLNDTAHTHGCCCCGGNEITNCAQINVNILAYALIY